MHIKESKASKAFDIFNYVFMTLLVIVTFYPLWYVVLASLSNSNLLMRNTGVLFAPLGFNLNAYKAVFDNPNILNGYKNTIIILTMSLTLNILLTTLGAYFLSRKRVKFKNAITLFIMFTMFFNGGLIPNYLVIRNLGILNTYWAVVLPTAITTYNMIIMRTGFAAIPDSMEESAKLDGANDFIVLFKIMFPLAKATIAVIVLYYAVSNWNSWFNAMIYMQQARHLQPLQLILRGILVENDTANMVGDAGADTEAIGESIKYAVIVVATLPILCAYPFLQKYFVKGVMIGAVKE